MTNILSGNTLIKEKYEWRVEGYKTDQPEKYELSLEFGNSYCSYAVFDQVTKFIKVVGKINFEFAEKKDSYAFLFSELQLNSGDILKKGYNRIYITWNTPGATLVPIAFYSEHLKSEILNFNTGQKQHQKIIHEEISGNEIRVIYSIPETIKLYFDSEFSNHSLKHISASLLEIISHSTSRNKDKIALININSSDFNLLLIDKGLRFFNTFNYTNPEDILYFALFAMDQNGFDQLTDRVLLAGEIENGSGIHKLLKQYIKNLSFAVTDKSLVRENKIAEMPHHYFFNLLNRLTCG